MSKISTASKLILSTGLVTVVSAGASYAQSAWDGFYGGVSFSSSMGEVFDGSGLDFEGTNGTAFAGFNQSFGSYIIGAEIESVLGGVATEDSQIFMSGLYDVKARAGMTYGNALIYVSAGLSSGQMSFVSQDYAVSGYNYGIGADYAVTDNMFVGINYTVRDMSDGDGYSLDTSSFSTVSIRAGYKF